MRGFLFAIIILALSVCFMLAQNKPTPLAWIEKGFLANPWGTKINELVEGDSLITNQDERKKLKKVTCNDNPRQQGPEKVYQCPVTVSINGWDISDVGFITQWDELTGVDFNVDKIPNADEFLKNIARDLGPAQRVEGEENVYLWTTGDVTLQVIMIIDKRTGRIRASITVNYNPAYVNPDAKLDPAKKVVSQLMSNIFGHEWGEDKDVMDKKGLLKKTNETEAESGICEGCRIYDSKEYAKSFGGVPMIMEYSGYYYNKKNKLMGALLMFDQKYYNSIVEAVNMNLGVSPYNNDTYAKIWNQKGICKSNDRWIDATYSKTAGRA
jgi:hypothetical protein